MRFDNQEISVTGVTRGGFEELTVALSLFPIADVIGYEDHKEKGLILYRHEHSAMTPFPPFFDKQVIHACVWNWLLSDDSRNHLPAFKPDPGVSVQPGWCVYNEEWTKVAHRSEAICAITPIWAMLRP